MKNPSLRVVAFGLLACFACREEPKPDATPAQAASPEASVAAATETASDSDIIDVGPFSKEFEAAVPYLSPRSVVVAWADERKCCYKLGKQSNPLKIRCTNPGHPDKPFQLDVDFDAEDRYNAKGVATDYMNWEKDSCRPS